MDYEKARDENGNPYLKVFSRDYALLSNPLLNKGSGFSLEERESLGLLGLIPPHVSTIEAQATRSYGAFRAKDTDLEKYIYLRDLQDSNEILFYYLLTRHIEEMLPIVYTPTVGLGCQRFSHVYRRPRGVFIAYPYLDRMDQILSNPRFKRVNLIVVSDGERILGLGDQGAGGMGIPIGKLALYTACAGINPATVLPVLLDTGTNNPDLQSDPLYMGWRHERVRGTDYENFVDTFVQVVKKRFPRVLLHWEDFAQPNAYPILEKYRDQLCTFNDDIQGTAAVTAGTLLAAMKASGIPLTKHRIAVMGAGSAGCGISSLIMKLMISEGLSEQEARSQFYLVDRNGLLIEGMDGILPFQTSFLQSRARVGEWKCATPNLISLKDVMINAHPTVLIGVCGQGGIFTEDIIKEMASHVVRPIIFPLSNPTSRCEATPMDLIQWTDNRVIVSTGSPFGEIDRNGKKYRVDQTNNCYIFPGVGLGTIVSKSNRITDKMFLAAARALADCSPIKTDPNSNLLPSIGNIREVSHQVAIAVAKEAIKSGLTDPNQNFDQLDELVRSRMWDPHYLPYKAASR